MLSQTEMEGMQRTCIESEPSPVETSGHSVDRCVLLIVLFYSMTSSAWEWG